MKSILARWPAMLAVFGAALATASAEPTLKVGDPAPKLQNGKYIQGEPVKEFKKGTAYVVEFWATWCGPCRDSIPHLNATYLKFKDKGLVVIGQDCYEKDESKVEPFVKDTMGSKMTYRVALDDKDGSPKGKMAETWMEAAGQNGIPAAFVVDTTGKIAWIGHPMTLKESVLEEVIAGKFDVAAEAERMAKERVETDKKDAEMAKKQAPVMKANEAFIAAMKEKKYDDAVARLGELEKLLPEQATDISITRMHLMISKQKDFKSAYALGKKISDENKDNVVIQNQLAWTLVSDPDIEKPDLELAQIWATRANDASGGTNPAIIDTLARVVYLRGKKEEAIALEEKAVKLAEGEEKQLLQKSLESYKKDELPKIGAE